MKGNPTHNSASADSSSGNDGPLSKTQSMSFGSHLSVTKLPLTITRCTPTRFAKIYEPAQRFHLDATQFRFQSKARSNLFQSGRMDAGRKITIIIEIRDHACLFAVTPLRLIIPRLPGCRDGTRLAVTAQRQRAKDKRAKDKRHIQDSEHYHGSDLDPLLIPTCERRHNCHVRVADPNPC